MNEIDKGVTVEKTVTMGETQYKLLLADRAELHRWQEDFERLRAELSKALRDCGELNECMRENNKQADAELDATIAERDRLRDALTYIVEMVSQRAMPDWDDPWLTEARAALKADTP